MLLAKANNLKKYQGWIYVLKCRGGRFYVGFSRNLSNRLKQHFTGNGAHFTRVHKPLRVLALRKTEWEEGEFSLWYSYARQHGTARVGGYSPYVCRALGFTWPFASKTKKVTKPIKAVAGWDCVVLDGSAAAKSRPVTHLDHGRTGTCEAKGMRSAKRGASRARPLVVDGITITL